MLKWARERARKSGVTFDLKPEDIEMPPCCPVLGTAWAYGSCAPSLDRILPCLGYVRGNVAVISVRANTIKSDARPDELEAVASWLRQRIEHLNA